MPEQVTCPTCDRPLRVPDHLIGTNVRCPSCQSTFIAAVHQRPEPELPLPDLSRRQPTGSEDGPQDGIRTDLGQGDSPPPRVPAQLTNLDSEDAPARPTSRRLLGSSTDDDDDEEEWDDRMRERRRLMQAERAREVAVSRVAGPAIGLIVVGSLQFLISLGQLAMDVVNYMNTPGPGFPIEILMIQIGFVLLGFLFGALVLWGGIQMKRMKSYGIALTGSIFALIPCYSCCILGLPFGIWALVVLNDSDVKASFN